MEENIEQKNFFLGVTLGYSNLNVSKNDSIPVNGTLENSGANLNLEIGYNYTENIDVSFNYKRVNFNDVLLDNLYLSSKYRFEEIYDLTPYLGLNLGYSVLSWSKNPISNTIDDDTKSGKLFAGTMLGLLYPINENIDLDFNYEVNYMGHKTKVENSSNVQMDIEHDYLQGINLGFRYKF